MTAAAILMLFGGQNLDGWVTLAGKWAIHESAMVCEAAPAAIRSSYESDGFTLLLRYRHAHRGTNRLFIHSRLDGPGTGLLLTPGGLTRPDDSSSGQHVPDDEWVHVRLEVTQGQARAVSTRADGRRLAETTVRIDPASRGFVRFEATEPGLQLQDIRAEESGFVPLFAEDTLRGWEIVHQRPNREPDWIIERGIVMCRGQGYPTWLRTLQTYDNFVLRLEYQLPPKSNSGIYLRAPLEGRVSQIGLEIQLIDDTGWKMSGSQHTGAVYSGIAPEVQAPTPSNQWNAIEVLCDGKRVRTTLNGVQLYDASLDDRAKDEHRSGNLLTTRRLQGFIGLQDHTGKPKFRNLRIRELPARAASRPAGSL